MCVTSHILIVHIILYTVVQTLPYTFATHYIEVK